MKRSIFIIVSLLCAVALWSCQTDNTTGTIGDSVTQLTITLPETRTSLGNKSGDTYPVYWSEGDCIVANGAKSEEATIDSTNPGNAIFDFGSTLTYPIKVTYPYTSTSTAEAPKVVLPTEQNYVANTFAAETSPMCGYAKNIGDKVVMSHLAGVLRFPVKASSEGTTLDKIVITSTEGTKLSGEFAVNCTTATMTATENSTNVITYNLPDNFSLSTSSESVFYIVIPAGEIGTCTVEFVETSGDKMTQTWCPGSVNKGVVREFKPITYNSGTVGSLEAYTSEEDELLILTYYETVYGFVKDVDGNPIPDVAVSDGFSVTATDSMGYYELNDVTGDCRYIYISLPSEYEVPINEYGQPCFYKKFEYPGTSPQYDFTLTPLPGGKEKEFALFTFGDPQVSAESRLTRFRNEAVPGIKKHYEEVAASGIPCYGITLGDIISNGSGSDKGAYRILMREGFSTKNVGLPVFQVMGNHDNTFFNAKKPINPDSRSSTFELAAQREHEDMFGPANYSFNRGDTHIIGMRDIVYTVNTSPSEYVTGFLDSQFEWLKQDLALVPKDKNVVLCVHIPLYNRDTNHIQEVLALLNTYKEAHIMSGHTHILHNVYEHKTQGTGYNNVFEHNMGAVCGCWWSSNMCSDGSPCGFGVFVGEGNTFSDWYYTGYHEGMNTREHQMRLYRGDAITGDAISGDNTNGTKGYYAFNFGEDVLLANVYFADSQWTIKVYENNVYSGNMTLVPKVVRPLLSSKYMTGDGSKTNPFKATKQISSDMYFTGLRLGILGSGDDATGSRAACYHLYQYKLKNKDSNIKVVAIDRFGNKYTETEITEGTDYSITAAK